MKTKILEKHRPLDTPEKVARRISEKEIPKKKYAADMQEIESNLIGYFSRPESIFDPETGNEICQIRKPTVEEVEALMPPDELRGIDSSIEGLKKLSLEERETISKKTKEFLNVQYKTLADIIMVPKKDAVWWKRNAPPNFLALVQTHIVSMLERMAGETENFR